MNLYIRLILSGMILLSFLTGWSLSWFRGLGLQADSCRDSYSFINISAVCGEPDVISKVGYAKTKADIEKFIAEEKKKGVVREASVYFRDLLHGPVFGINEDVEFSPASLLKLPLALVYFKEREEYPSLFAVSREYRGINSAELIQNYQPRERLEQGTVYSVEDLLRRMITFSDNDAYEVMEQYLEEIADGKNLRTETFREIGLIDPKSRAEESLSVKGYGSIFRGLFNASYLDAVASEQLLSWLAESDFEKGLVAGVPSGIRVAHKFGEREFRAVRPDGATVRMRQLHDCGIVYFPKNPYLLCIMTRGGVWSDLENVIATISKIVYKEVDSRRI